MVQCYNKIISGPPADGSQSVKKIVGRNSYIFFPELIGGSEKCGDELSASIITIIKF